MFHSYHLAMEEGENYAAYQERRLEVLRDNAHTHVFQATLDVIETQARFHKDECFSAKDDDVALQHRLAAKVLDDIYAMLVSQTTMLPRAEERQEQRQRRVRLDRDAELRVKDKARALAAAGSRAYSRPNMR